MSVNIISVACFYAWSKDFTHKRNFVSNTRASVSECDAFAIHKNVIALVFMKAEYIAKLDVDI